MSPPPDSPHGRREANQAFPLIGRQGWISVVISLTHTHRKLFSDFTSTYEYQLEKKNGFRSLRLHRKTTQHAKSLLKRITEIEVTNAKDKSSLYRKIPPRGFLSEFSLSKQWRISLMSFNAMLFAPAWGRGFQTGFSPNNAVYQKKIKG